MAKKVYINENLELVVSEVENCNMELATYDDLLAALAVNGQVIEGCLEIQEGIYKWFQDDQAETCDYLPIFPRETMEQDEAYANSVWMDALIEAYESVGIYC